jgi:glycerate-2-kinase
MGAGGADAVEVRGGPDGARAVPNALRLREALDVSERCHAVGGAADRVGIDTRHRSSGCITGPAAALTAIAAATRTAIPSVAQAAVITVAVNAAALANPP